MKTIILTQGLLAKVSDSDFVRANKHKWYACRAGDKFYARRSITVSGRLHKQYLHRFITGENPKYEVDHKNGDTLDCRRSNLRYATHAQNIRNQKRHRNNLSGYKGVSRSGRGWRSIISVNNKDLSLGSFGSAVDAAMAYDEAARKYFGRFAKTNFEG